MLQPARPVPALRERVFAVLADGLRGPAPAVLAAMQRGWNGGT